MNTGSSSKRFNIKLRYVVLALILIISTFLGLMHQFAPQTRIAGVDAFCPFGGAESLWTFISRGEFIRRTALSSLILLCITILIALVFRRSFCGNLCPLGFMQELVRLPFKKVFPRSKGFVIPKALDRVLRFLPLVILIVFTGLSWKLSELVIRPLDPWATYHHLASADLFEEFVPGLIILVIALVGSVFYERFFCKYLCPMGAFLKIIAPMGVFAVERNEESCINCMKCSKVCPMNIEVHSLKRVSTTECINCSSCVDVCPVAETLEIKGAGVPIKSDALTLITLVVFMVSIFFTAALNYFDFTVPALETVQSESAAFTGDDLRGIYTYSEISKATGIPKQQFIERFKLTEEQYNQPIKVLTHKVNPPFTMDDLRAFVDEANMNK